MTAVRMMMRLLRRRMDMVVRRRQQTTPLTARKTQKETKNEHYQTMRSQTSVNLVVLTRERETHLWSLAPTFSQCQEKYWSRYVTLLPFNSSPIIAKTYFVQILKSVLKVDGALSDHEFHFKCPTRACSQKLVNDPETPIVQYLQVREVLKSCKQIRNEGERIFFKINEWTLHRPRLRMGVGLNPKFLAEDAQKMFNRYIPCGHTEQEKCSRTRIPHVRYFRNFNMQIAISPTAIVDLPLPDGVDPCDAAQVERAHIMEDQEVVRRHTLTELEQCEMYGAALSGFVQNQGGMFQDLRLLSLEISLHSPVHRARSGPRKRCGTTFRVRILLDASTKVDYATHPEPPTMFDELDLDLKKLDARRRMLAPLLKLRGVRSVEVRRRWSILYKVVKKESEDYIAYHALGQIARYDCISEFLDKAGPHFANLLNTGLEHFNIPSKDLIRIVEDDDKDHVIFDSVPPAENGELLENY